MCSFFFPFAFPALAQPTDVDTTRSVFSAQVKLAVAIRTWFKWHSSSCSGLEPYPSLSSAVCYPGLAFPAFQVLRRGGVHFGILCADKPPQEAAGRKRERVPIAKDKVKVAKQEGHLHSPVRGRFRHLVHWIYI